MIRAKGIQVVDTAVVAILHGTGPEVALTGWDEQRRGSGLALPDLAQLCKALPLLFFFFLNQDPMDLPSL